MATLKDYEMLGELGRGSYGIVHRVKNKHDNKIYVLKQVDIGKLNLRQKKQAQAEANILKQLRSPYVVRYYHSFLERGNLNIVMEFCQGGDLEKYMKRLMGRPMKEEQIWKFFIQICIGLRDIHHKRILHRDIKTMNIFLTKEEQIRIGDLGVAKALQTDFAVTYVGTPYYLSPEMCQEKPYNEKTDIWALGCILYQMCTGKYPFDAANQAALAMKIVTGRYTPIPNTYSTQMAEMVQQCLSVDHKRRPTASYILEKPYVKNFIVQKGLKTKTEEVFEKETSGIRGNSIPLRVKSKEKQENEPPKTEINFHQPDEDEEVEKLPDNPRVNEPTLKPSKWNKPVKAQVISQPVRFFNVKGEKIAEKSSQKAQQKEQKVIPKYPPPPVKKPVNIKTPHVPPKIPVSKPISAKNIREEQRQKEEERRMQLKLEQEKREEKVREFEKKTEEMRKEKARKSQERKKQQQQRKKEVKSRNQREELSGKEKIEIVVPRRTEEINKEEDTLIIPDLIDSDEEIDFEKQKKQERAAIIVGMAQQKVDDGDLLKEFGDMKMSIPAPPSPKKTTATTTLPTYTEDFSEPQQAIVVEYDPNEIMQQLEQVEPCESSVESVQEEMCQDNQLLIQEKTMEQSQERLKKVLIENLKRQETIQKLIADKEKQLFVSLDKQKYKELKKLVGQADERELEKEFKCVKAFADQKILYLFYKIMLYDSQKEECQRNIHEINKRLKN